MALIACTECGHKISSLARFCPKCNHVHNAPCLAGSIQEQLPSPNDAFHSGAATCGELLQSEFKPSIDEMILLEGRTFLVKGLFNVFDGYAYFTSKRYALCDASGVNIVFQIGNNGIASVREGRHLISKIIIITTVSGEKFQVKSLPHAEWFTALLDPNGFADALIKPRYNLSNASNSSHDWYYEAGGINIGPVEEKSIIQLILNNHTIFRNTKVWNSSLPEWKRADETILTIYFSEPAMPGIKLKQAKMGFNLFRLGFLPRLKMLCRKYF